MRTKTEIDADIAHIEYAKTILDDQCKVLKAERDLLREDKYTKDKTTKRLAEFFKSHGLYIVDFNYSKRSNEFYYLAKQIWRNYYVLIPFIQFLSANKNNPFVYDTASLPASSRNDLRNLCRELASKKWLAFDKCDTGFAITPSLTRAQKKFAHGVWAEEMTLYLIDKTLKDFTKKCRMKHKLFWNVRLKFISPVTDKKADMELDLIAQAGERFYVFEAKSGTVLSVAAWVDRTRMFDDNSNRFITCTALQDINPEIFKGFRLFALPTLEEQFSKMLMDDFKVTIAPNDEVEQTSSEQS